ncbi:MAG: NAD-dependent DNA ligase LigA [Bacteroidales bacterium]|nr:NAD-dependent DNA ligase LigA [Bacteroidales bacterium]
MDINQAKTRIAELRKTLNHHNHLYYVEAAPIIGDYEFDQLMRELATLEAQFPELDDPNSPTRRVGSDRTSSFAQIRHQHPMLSLANAYSPEELMEFDTRARRALGTETPRYICELKYDGVAIALTYRHGQLMQAVTRGDGINGDDVTANVRTIRTIPLTLHGNYPDEFEIRGEIIMPHSVFAELNAQREEAGETPFANPRNATAGTIKLLNSAEVARRRLDCFLYYLPGDYLPQRTHYERCMEAKNWGFKISEQITPCNTMAEVLQFIDHWEAARRELPYDTDGVVIKIDNLDHQQSLGLTAKTPRWAVAYKYKPERVCTPLLSVDFQVGRTGAITPVANLQPIKLAGTTVKRASLHNADQIDLLDIRIGDWVYVEKGGEIIPKIVGIEQSKRSLFSEPLIFPTLCPSCGTPLIKPEGEARHFCPNAEGCPPQQMGKVEHFISRRALNIDGLGQETVALLFSSGLITNAADLYKLTVPKLAKLERFAAKSAHNAVASIEASKQIPFARVLYGIGIRYVGETTARSLAEHFGCIEALAKASVEELTQVPDVGERIAQSIVQYFTHPNNIALVEALTQAGLQMAQTEADKPTTLSNALDGLSVVISGSFSRISRDDLKKLIAQHGGRNVSGISASTSMLVAGDKIGPAKLQKATQLGIKIVSEDEFFSLIESAAQPQE